MKKAFVTGISGQDGSYLAELLLSKGYEVHGIVRRSSSVGNKRLDEIFQEPTDASRRLFLHYGDLSDAGSLTNLLRNIVPDEVYNLGAQSHVKVSFDVPDYTGEITGLGSVRLLEAIRNADLQCKYYQASSSEMFGKSPSPQNEITLFQPRSPYASAKVFAYHTTINYREAYGLFACNGILFNHESPRRGETFVTRKISLAAAKIYLGLQDSLTLGNLEAKRDWGYAPEYVHAMWQMMQANEPLDLVIATGVSTTVKEFAKTAFQYLGLDAEKYIRFSESYIRPTEVEDLLGDSSKAEKTIGWKASTHWKELAEIMVKADVALIENQLRGSSAF